MGNCIEAEVVGDGRGEGAGITCALKVFSYARSRIMRTSIPSESSSNSDSRSSSYSDKEKSCSSFSSSISNNSSINDGSDAVTDWRGNEIGLVCDGKTDDKGIEADGDEYGTGWGNNEPRGFDFCFAFGCRGGRGRCVCICAELSSSAEQKCMSRLENRALGVGAGEAEEERDGGGLCLAQPPTPSATPIAFSRTK